MEERARSIQWPSAHRTISCFRDDAVLASNKRKSSCPVVQSVAIPEDEQSHPLHVEELGAFRRWTIGVYTDASWPTKLDGSSQEAPRSSLCTQKHQPSTLQSH